VTADTREERGAWVATHLWPLDTRETARLTLSPSRSPRCWLLEQAGRPVGVIERARGRDRFRTISEEWDAFCRRTGRFGWQLEFWRPHEAEPELCYHPPSLLPAGGRLVLAGGRGYHLRGSLQRADWRITARRRGQIGRIAFRRDGRVADHTKYVRFGDQATDEPLLLVVMLAASVATLIHAEEPSLTPTFGTPW
jgi:hypothetical protein